MSECQSGEGERNVTMRVKFPLKEVTCLFMTSTDSAGDVKKTHKESMYPVYPKVMGRESSDIQR